MPKKRPKIGLALSGASGRAIAHIGVLEVLREHNIPIDYITACSSGTIIAGSFACGTMEELKKFLFSVDKKSLFKLFAIDKKGGGLFTLEQAMEVFKKFTLDKRFEEVKPVLAFLACDLATGEPVALQLGDLARACQASCAVPGIFSPVQWGNRILVDGGLFSLVPTEQAYKMGADIVIGVDIAATKYMYKKSYLHIWRGYNFLRNSLLLRPFRWLYALFNQVYEYSVKMIFYNQSDFFDENLIENNPDLFAILDRSMAIASEKHRQAKMTVCDVMLQPKVNHLGKINLKKSQVMYEEGRRVALAAIPEIKRLIHDSQWKLKHETKIISRLEQQVVKAK